MGTCSKCGIEMKEAGTLLQGVRKGTPDRRVFHEGQKSARHEQGEIWVKPAVIAVVVVLVAAAGFGFMQYRASRMGGRSYVSAVPEASTRVTKTAPVTAQNGDITIPVEDGGGRERALLRLSGVGQDHHLLHNEDSRRHDKTAFEPALPATMSKLGYAAGRTGSLQQLRHGIPSRGDRQ